MVFFLELCVLYAYHAAGRCKIYNRHGAAAGGILAVSDVSERIKQNAVFMSAL